MNYSEYLEYINSRYTKEQSDQRSERVAQHPELLHACLGLSGETGELIDEIKKSIFYGRPFDSTKLLSELGDVLHYYMRLADMLNYSLPTIMTYNVDKLEKRDAANPTHYKQTQSEDEMLARLNGMIK